VLGRVRRRTLLPDAPVRGVLAPSLCSCSRRPIPMYGAAWYGEALSPMIRGVLVWGGSGSKHDRRSPSNRITTSGMSRAIISCLGLNDLGKKQSLEDGFKNPLYYSNSDSPKWSRHAREACRACCPQVRAGARPPALWPTGGMSFLGQVADTWQALIDLIIRPPRHEYSVQRELGPQRLVVKGGLVIREDIEVHAAAASRPVLRAPCTPVRARARSCARVLSQS
jgi:hypothetical protein